MNTHRLEKGSVPPSIIALIAFALIAIGGLWYMSYTSKANIDRILQQHALEKAASSTPHTTSR